MIVVFLQYVSALKPPRKKTPSRSSLYADSERFDEMNICKNRRGSMTFPRPLGTRESFQRRSLQDFSRTVARTVEEEFEVRRRQAEFSMSSFSNSQRILGSAPSTESEPDSSEIIDTGSDDWKQVGFIDVICFGSCFVVVWAYFDAYFVFILNNGVILRPTCGLWFTG